MMTTRKRIFIVASIFIGLLIVVLLIVAIVRAPEAQEELPQATGEPNVTQETGRDTSPTRQVVTPTGERPQIVSDEDVTEQYARQVARMFVEQFATYSNQNGNAHIDAVLSMATPRMALWLETQRLEQGDVYYGVTTAVIASAVESISDSSATISVEVHQLVEDENGSHTEQRSGTVELVGTTTDWQIDGLFWEE